MKPNVVKCSAGKRITTAGGGATAYGGNIDMNSNPTQRLGGSRTG